MGSSIEQKLYNRVWACCLSAMCLLLAMLLSSGLAAAEQELNFAGWEDMRVIALEDWTASVLCEDIDGDGRAEVVTVNNNKSRLDIFEWLPVEKRKQEQRSLPNELPMAEEWTRTDIRLDQLPTSVRTADITKDGDLELIVQVLHPARIIVLDQQNNKWSEQFHIDLLDGETRRHFPMLVHNNNAVPTVLVSCDDGVQEVVLQEGARPCWQHPRERTPVWGWGLADINNDGSEDVVSWLRDKERPLVAQLWSHIGFAPMQSLGEIDAHVARLLRHADGSTNICTISEHNQQLVRRYTLGTEEVSAWGDVRSISYPENALCTSVMCGERKALIVCDNDSSQMRDYYITEDGWQAGDGFPSVTDIVEVVTPAAAPQNILLYTKGGSELLRSQWTDGRLSFPVPWACGPEDDAETSKKILALGSAGSTAWWVQAVTLGKKSARLHLFQWALGQIEPTCLTFAMSGKEIEQAQYLGNNRLLVWRKFSKEPELLYADGAGQTQVTKMPHLKGVPKHAFPLLQQPDGTLRLARLEKGVIQWLDEDLQATDQVMIGDGQFAISWLCDATGQVWLLEQGGKRVHLMEPDAGGILRVAQTETLPGGRALMNDHILGTVLIGHGGLSVIGAGASARLHVVQSIDATEDQPQDDVNPQVHRLLAADIDGDGGEELLLADDFRHQLSAYHLKDGSLQAVLSWKVFTDEKYPYGGQGGDQPEPEPRRISVGDVDGDGAQDCVLYCHDRMLIYLAQKQTFAEQTSREQSDSVEGVAK